MYYFFFLYSDDSILTDFYSNFAEGFTKSTFCFGSAFFSDPCNAKACDQANGDADCDPLEYERGCKALTTFFFESCADLNPEGTCRLSTRLLEVQTHRLGKGLGNKRGWSETIEEEDIPLN